MSKPSTQPDNFNIDEDEPEFSSKDVYERLLNIVALNTNNEHQEPTMPASSLWSIVCHGNLPESQAIKGYQAAIQNGDLLKHDGHLARTDEDSLRAVIEHEVQRDGEPDRELIGKCNRHLSG